LEAWEHIMSTTVKLSETQAIYAVPFDESALAEGPVFLERKGRRVAVIIPADEFEEFRLWRDNQSRQQKSLDQLQNERAAFRRLLPELLETHPGQFVALQDGRLIDADADEGALARRTLNKAGKPVYIQEVRAEPRVYEVPSPEVVRHVPL
jgi:PHD/YefM family antitoxin component YafN of YafNO toxin-antitoxin module